MNGDNWADRSSHKCETCMWFVAKSSAQDRDGETTRLGRCRRHAPTMAGFPVVFKTDFCGDHKLA